MKDQILNLVAKNKLEKVLNIVKRMDPKAADLNKEYQSLEKEKLLGVISFTDYAEKRQSLVMRLLNLLRDFEWPSVN